MTQVYSYDPATLEYTHEQEANIDPIAGTPMVPAYATLLRPSPKSGEVAVFNVKTQEWDFVEDHRGTQLWLKTDSSVTDLITDLGPINPKYTKVTPPESEVLHTFDDDTGKWSIDADSLKAKTLEDIHIYAEDARTQITQNAYPVKLIGWIQKKSIAEKVINGTASPHDIDVITKEAELRGKGETANQLAKKQLAKAKKLSLAIAVVDGLESKAVNYIESTTDKPDVIDSKINKMKASAETELAKLMA